MSTQPTGTPASLQSLTVSDGARRHLVWVRCLSHTASLDNDQWSEWLAACYRLTAHVQRFGPDTALLDLGTCTDAEALTAVQALLTRLQMQPKQSTLRAAIAPTGLLAQLALLSAPAHESLTLLTPQQARALLQQMPITALTHLQFADQTSFPPKMLTRVVAKLDGYGIRSLAHLTRFDAAYLRRQFGSRLGSFLLAVARGEDMLPFQPTPAPLRLHFRLQLTAPLAADRLLAALKPFTLEVASALARRGVQAHTLGLRLHWESGAVQRVSRTLPQPVAGGRMLYETVQRLLRPLIRGERVRQEGHAGVDGMDHVDGIEDVRLIVSHLVPLYPAQHAFWPQRARRLAALDDLADVLARRYGKPLLLSGRRTAPDAIFEQDRSHLAPMAAPALDTADVLEGQEDRGARPAANVADVHDASATSAEIRHGVHWW